ncbi:MAG: hypothetical protein IJ660_02220, partial [Alphaproteobacteria bacterium]|nr:hypothetical protein [Alphaproteobacteria bacterium]
YYGCGARKNGGGAMAVPFLKVPSSSLGDNHKSDKTVVKTCVKKAEEPKSCTPKCTPSVWPNCPEGAEESSYDDGCGGQCHECLRPTVIRVITGYSCTPVEMANADVEMKEFYDYYNVDSKGNREFSNSGEICCWWIEDSPAMSAMDNCEKTGSADVGDESVATAVPY